jgi:hypothetical protein
VSTWRLMGRKVGKHIIAGLVEPNPNQDFWMLRQKEFNALALFAAVATLAGRRKVRWLITAAIAAGTYVVYLLRTVAAVKAGNVNAHPSASTSRKIARLIVAARL